MAIDWTDTESQITPHFKVREALYLPSWKILHTPSEEEKENIVKMAEKMEQIRDFIGFSISIHCWIRPEAVNCPGSPFHGQSYNKFVGGAPKSAHRLGLAVDWDADGQVCETIRQMLIPKLDEFDIRMEDNGVLATWVHLDLMSPNPNRFFKP